MSAKDDGGSAFPISGWNSPNGDYFWPSTGMSLRDYFAAQALTFLGPMVAAREHGLSGDGGPIAALARDAYEIADAMIEERKK